VLSVDGANAKSAMTILDALGDNKKGDVVIIDIVRGDAPATLRATLVDDPGPEVRAYGRFERNGNMPDIDKMLPDMAPGFDNKRLEEALDQMRKRLEEIEQRLDQKRT
jgi:hypothetical protein